MLAAAFVLGVTTQGAKIATDTVVQTSVDDAYRGRVFSLYDVLFNVAFVGAAARRRADTAADGRSAALVVRARGALRCDRRGHAARRRIAV